MIGPLHPIPDEHLPADLHGRVTASMVELGAHSPTFRIYLDGNEVGTITRQADGWHAAGDTGRLHATRAVAAVAVCRRSA